LYSLWPTTETLSRCSLLSKCMILWYMCTHKKSTVSPVLNFTTLMNAQWHYLYISHTKFHPNWTIHAESMDRISLMPLSELRIALYQFSQNSKFLNGNIWSCIVNFTLISLQIYKVWVDIYCCLYVTDLIFMKLMLVWQLHVLKFYTEFSENVADTRPEMDNGWIDTWTDRHESPHKYFFFSLYRILPNNGRLWACYYCLLYETGRTFFRISVCSSVCVCVCVCVCVYVSFHPPVI
jgi:hypothetical protein